MALASAAAILDTSNRATQLEAVAASGACEAERVIVLDFGLIQQRTGARWNAKRESVWVQIERTIARNVSAASIFCRVDQTEYLVCFAEEHGFAAHALGFRIMEEVLTFFLGACSPDDLLVKSVTAISDGVITASRVECRIEHLARRSATPQPAAVHRYMAPAPALTQIIDDEVHLSCMVEDVISLKADRVVGSRLAARFHDLVTHRSIRDADQAALATRTLLKADLHMLKLLEWLAVEQPDRLLIAPLSLQAFGSSRSRFAVFELLHELGHRERGRLIFELSGLEAGTPSSRIVEAMTALKPFCRAVMARTTAGRTSMANARAARISALSVTAAEIGGGDSRLAAGLLAFGAAAKEVAPMLMATELPGRGFLSVCTVAGFTHATVRGAA